MGGDGARRYLTNYFLNRRSPKPCNARLVKVATGVVRRSLQLLKMGP